MKVVDTREYVGMLKELTEEGKEVSMLVFGSSMAPFLIHARDMIYFKKPGNIAFLTLIAMFYFVIPDIQKYFSKK